MSISKGSNARVNFKELKVQLSEIEEKLDSGTPIKCPHCHDENTVKIYQDGYSYQYRCNNCLKISLIDIVFSVVNVNGIDGDIVFVDGDSAQSETPN